MVKTNLSRETLHAFDEHIIGPSALLIITRKEYPLPSVPGIKLATIHTRCNIFSIDTMISLLNGFLYETRVCDILHVSEN